MAAKVTDRRPRPVHQVVGTIPWEDPGVEEEVGLDRELEECVFRCRSIQTRFDSGSREEF